MALSHKFGVASLVIVLGLAGAACGGDDPSEVVLVTHDSFVVSDDVRQAFEDESGLVLKILQTGDAAEALTKALLTGGNPQGDVFFGLDNNLLSRALDAELFDPYEPSELAGVDEQFVLDSEHRVTPVDHGDVCLNYDKTWFAERALQPPRSLNDLTAREYDGLVVVENPATSTPGLAFMLATIARYGEDGWRDFWRRLRSNHLLVVDGWEEAYNVRFSGSAGKGDRPIVVSYATSPVAEVIFRTPRPAEAPTAVLEDSCFRQIEFAGVLRGARNEQGARKLVDFMLSRRFQEDIPLTMFVLPVSNEAALPPEFEKHAVVPRDPLDLSPSEIDAHLAEWLDEWLRTVLR